MFYFIKVMTIDDDYEGVIDLEVLSAELKSRLVKCVEVGKANGHDYGEIYKAEDKDVDELLEQHFMSPINFPHHVAAIVEVTSKDYV